MFCSLHSSFAFPKVLSFSFIQSSPLTPFTFSLVKGHDFNQSPFSIFLVPLFHKLQMRINCSLYSMENLVKPPPPPAMALTDCHTFPATQYEFMELLGLQDLSSYSYHDASSISTASRETTATNKMPLKATEEVEDGGCMKPNGEEDGIEEPMIRKKAVIGTKRAEEKKNKETRFAFMTKSDVDNLEDGYRWRKYGQKAVKNSLFPRSYYRCTTASCNVKKRVERSHADPAIVVTTYEGQHTHPSPLLMPRLLPHHSTLFLSPPTENNAISGTAGTASSLQPNCVGVNRLGGPYYSSPTVSSFPSVKRPGQTLLQRSTIAASRQKRRFASPKQSATAGLVGGGDHGLLQDIVPSQVLEEVN
ncbi:hypothetical protein SAY87_010105 [Trapa incisa]|uniref:WRKY domain-containing protein n=1 Tax=Trapa incisa TaxID=236973 RepID=A0AAN7GP01_9MYRT|nr:hypothetical protein SAY87_010105 [Trapa incisa]